MAHSHVPKFGDWWDKDNPSYTTCFENARKEKACIRMNPNYPEENPEAFEHVSGGLESNRDYQPLQVPLAAGSNKSNSAGKQHGDGQGRQNATNRNGCYDHQKVSRSHRSMASESGSEKSSSDHLLLQSNHRRANSGQKKGRAGGSSFSSSVSGQSSRSGSHQVDGNEHPRTTTASIPKFGEWDETDPTSGERFTAIFSKVKEEKQASSSNFPTVLPQPQPSNYSDDHQSKQGSPSWCSKICCCLFPRGK